MQNAHTHTVILYTQNDNMIHTRNTTRSDTYAHTRTQNWSWPTHPDMTKSGHTLHKLDRTHAHTRHAMLALDHPMPFTEGILGLWFQHFVRVLAQAKAQAFERTDFRSASQ